MVRATRVLAASLAALTVVALPGDEPSRRAPARASGAAAPAPPEALAPTPASGPQAASTTRAPRSFTLVATGDVLLHERLWDQAATDAAAAGVEGFDFRPLLAGVEPLVEGADVAFCHLETPVAPPAGPFSGYPAFSVPADIVPALADTGFDACSTASNHTYDRGAAGVDHTLDALDAAGIRHAGSARTPAEATTTTVVTVGGADVTLLAYTFGFNGVPAPDGQTWRSNPIDEGRILADAARARTEGADVVVVALHWGDEFRAEPNGQQRALAPGLVRSPDIDLLLGHHAHVVQPIEAVDGEWVVYGMGNLVADHGTALPANEEGLLVRFTFTEEAAGWRVSGAEYAPLLVSKPGPPVRLVDVGAALGDAGADPARRSRLQVAWDRTVGTVGALGAHDHGLRTVAR
jgi:poly-gamma-glutamate capsule biosynthesis protein CapA/YwtB (metallophosphatase superfamily)